MARRDERNRNNRTTIKTTQRRDRVIDGGTTDQTVRGTYYKAPGSDRVEFYAGELTAGDSPYAVGNWNDGFKTVESGMSARSASASAMGSQGNTAGGSSTTFAGDLVVSVDNGDKRVSETITSSRMQALDKISGDDDAQKQRQLKTKREGRNALRIQKAGDASAGRLKGGPNSGRQRNKLKIDVQSAGAGGTGINAPR